LGVTQRQNILSAEEFALQLDKFEGILAELVSSICEGAFPIEPVSPRICSYCAFQGICRKEVGLSGF
ncbi:MAG: PD-(D/E)XK nuclease family protein, partial [Limnochordia bacterium]